jgi:hypothetical protein
VDLHATVGRRGESDREIISGFRRHAELHFRVNSRYRNHQRHHFGNMGEPEEFAYQRTIRDMFNTSHSLFSCSTFIHISSVIRLF